MVNLPDYQQRLKSLGLRIGYLRRRTGMTQEALADQLDVSWSSISKIETGVACPSLRMIWGICQILQVEPRTLFDE